MKQKIAIVSIGSISPLGSNSSEILNSYLNSKHCLVEKSIEKKQFLCAPLQAKEEKILAELKASNNKYKTLDKSVLMAIAASRIALQNSPWNQGDRIGINIGSSRGATESTEKYHKEYLETNRAATLSSPNTTLGNVSSWIASDLQTKGPVISHSITCSTALHALLNGIAWLQSDMATGFLVGGTEAALSPFTFAQMRALKITTNDKTSKYPSRALDLDKKQNTMVLGEGASVIGICKGTPQNALAYISGIGYATDILTHSISISKNAECFQESMRMAMENHDPSTIDAIVMHAPGTIKGDQSEYNAIQKVFPDSSPALTSNKWKIGHTFGASGMLSVEMGIQMLQNNRFFEIPFSPLSKKPKQLRKVLINAVGFGGNAVSVLIESTP